jgi:hypothetical protein
MKIEQNKLTGKYPLYRHFAGESVNLGNVEHELVFEKGSELYHPSITWTFTPPNEEEEEVVIALAIEGERVTDYFGVSSLPALALMLLRALGYDCSEIEEREGDIPSPVTCALCGSDKVIPLADAVWNGKEGRWSVAWVNTEGYCKVCDQDGVQLRRVYEAI